MPTARPRDRETPQAGRRSKQAEPEVLAPMEARSEDTLPSGEGWQYEPKWDGFRCLAHIASDGAVDLRGKSGKPLARYFPDVVAHLETLSIGPCTLDGELVIPVGETLSFEELQMRLHPAESRVRKLAAAHPARLVLFDCLEAEGKTLVAEPLSARRAALEALVRRVGADPVLRLSPFTLDRAEAQGWLDRSGGALDGVVAKRRDGPYEAGERAMVKVKLARTADCVVGGFRYESGGRRVGSLLLGLYDDEGLLNHVGFTSAISAADRPELTRRLEALVEAPGFTGRAPGGPSRWSTARSADWRPLRPELVVEVHYDQVTADRFRHGTSILRWRPDKPPRTCTLEQLGREARPGLLVGAVLDEDRDTAREAGDGKGK
jgi:ATP-dependent DNA ligase